MPLLMRVQQCPDDDKDRLGRHDARRCHRLTELGRFRLVAEAGPGRPTDLRTPFQPILVVNSCQATANEPPVFIRFTQALFLSRRRLCKPKPIWR